MKKALSLILAIIMMASMAVGCAQETPQTTPAESADTQDADTAAEGSETSEQETTMVSEEPVTFTFFNTYLNMPFDSSWPVFEEAVALTNVTLEGYLSESTSDETAAYNLMLSSGELADFISYASITDMEKLGRDGGLIVLNDLIEEHAPDMMAAFDEYPELRKMATSADGNIYVIPKLQTTTVAEGDFIRMDWLEAVDMEVPNTIDELYDVLTAFRNEDPNGNGEKDEIPFFSRQGHAHFNDVLNLWDAHQSYYLRDGQITFGPMEDEFKLAMENAIKWYDEELIDPEIFTRGGTTRDVLLGADIGGYCSDWFGSNADYNDKLAGEIEGFSFMPMAPVENQNGERIAHTARTASPGWGVSSQCEDPVTAVKYMNFWFTEEGSALANFGIEGVTYTVEGDEKVYTDAIMNTDKTALAELRSYGVQYRIGMLQDFAYEEAWSNEISNEGVAMYEENGYVYVPLPMSGDQVALKYTAEQEEEYKKIMSSVTPYVAEMIQKWVLGSEDFEESYPDFIASLEEKGINEAIAINQVAYEAYMNS